VGFARGSIEKAWPSSAGMLSYSGWAILPERGKPADAVFLTYDNEKGEPIIFAAAEQDAPRDDIARAEGDPVYAAGGWVATFPAAKLPGYLREIKITAWALDTRTAKACRLAMVVVKQ